MPVQFNLSEFSAKSELEKKKTTLQLLMSGIEKIAVCHNWRVEPFKETALIIEELGYLNEWTWKKAITSPNKKYNAKVLCQHNVKTMDIYIAISHRDGTQVLLEKVKSAQPDEFAYARHLGALTWESDYEVALINKKGNEKFVVAIK